MSEWAVQEADWTGGLNYPIEQPSWKHGYAIYLKIFYDIHAKWEQTSDAEKLQQLTGQIDKYISNNLKSTTNKVHQH